MKKIVILSGSTGGGHVKAARSLELWAKKAYNDEVEIINIDVIKHMSSVFKKMYADSYINIIKYYPALYGHLYEITDLAKNKKAILKEMRYYFEELFSKRFKKEIKQINPDCIIFTHFLPAEHMNKSAAVKKYADKYAVVVTDFDVHSLWVQDKMDIFFVATDETAARLADRGIDRDKIHVTGIPIEPHFSYEYSKRQSKIDLGLNPELDTVLFMAGAYGVGHIDTMIDDLFKGIDKKFQIIALTGSNKELFQSLVKLNEKYPYTLRVVDFTNEVNKYMAASDFAVTKTGGLTTSECLAMGVPIITMNPIPGQEEKNTDYLLENGVGLKTSDMAGLIYRVNSLLNNKDLLLRMQKNARDIAHPKAGFDILHKLLEDM